MSMFKCDAHASFKATDSINHNLSVAKLEA